MATLSGFSVGLRLNGKSCELGGGSIMTFKLKELHVDCKLTKSLVRGWLDTCSSVGKTIYMYCMDIAVSWVHIPL